jgi:hypothetical protein
VETAVTGTELRLAFITAALTALGTVVIRAMFGRKVAWVIGFIGSLCVFVPFALIIVFGVAGFLESGPAGQAQASQSTVAAIVDYMIKTVPGLLISAVAGAFVGFLLSLLKKATPRRVRSRVKRRLRVRLADRRT